MSKILSASVLSLMMVLLLAGCGGEDGADAAAETSDKAAAEHPVAEKAASEHPTPEHPHSAETDSVKAEHSKSDHPN